MKLATSDTSPEGAATPPSWRRIVRALFIAVPLTLAVVMIGYAVATVFHPGPTLTFVGTTPSPLRAGQPATLTVHIVPGARCQIVVFYESATSYERRPNLQGLQVADAAGMVQWHWQIPQRIAAGPVDAAVTCAINGTTVTGEHSYGIAP